MKSHREHRDEKGRHSPAQSAVAKRMRGEGAKEHKMEKVMHEFKHGELHSGSKHGKKVKSRAQAIAIGMSEANKAAHGGKKHHGKKHGKHHHMSMKKREHEHMEKKKRHEKE